jgi:CBS domain-containing protein
MLKDLVCRELATVEPDATLYEVARLMESRGVGSVLVLSRGRPRGIITDRDIVVRCVAQNLDLNDTTVENVLTECLATCLETDGVYDCIRKMSEAGVRRMPVVNERGEATGIISFSDLVMILSKEFGELAAGMSHLDRDELDSLRAA